MTEKTSCWFGFGDISVNVTIMVINCGRGTSAGDTIVSAEDGLLVPPGPIVTVPKLSVWVPGGLGGGGGGPVYVATTI
jgi:hypothetical protein